eukprot:Phypoly_transcript_00472.p2 GENE.Phypoly_transcript_00472~~Phypoly_transcript_00472.p2  ORF type:complete len:588 (-),score=89.43 Phypoly_transcript_00472:2960-4543(-)
MDQKQFNKFLAAQSVVCKKSKKTPSQEFAFVYFENVQQKEEAKKLHGLEVKGKKLSLQDMEGKKGRQRKQKPEAEVDAGPPNVNKSTAPLWNTPYAEQLEKKAIHAQDIILKIVKQIRRDSKHAMLDWVKKNDSFPFEGVRPTPITNKYRNKVQFTIGLDSSGIPCVGFVVGKFLQGQHVMSPEGAVTVPNLAMHVRDVFQEFINSSPFKPYILQEHTGFWRLLTVKAFTRTNEVMVIVQVKAEGFPADDYVKEKKRLVEFIAAKKASGLVITSVMIQEYSGLSNDSPLDVPCLPLWGESHVHEKLLNQTFRISPHAFFQVNTLGAEVLYKIVRQWCAATPDSILLDLCCGTGTIGQCIADSVKEVLGIEMSEDAVADANVNAELNGHKNVKYIAGKVEDVLAKSFSTLSSGPIIAVVDPPRPGLHKSVLSAIRANKKITRLIYVSCEPQSLIQNCSALCRTESKKAVGTPFWPVNSVAVDMFPHTDKLEMIVLFERVEEASKVTKIENLAEKTDTEAKPEEKVASE